MSGEKGIAVGAARIVSELPISDGTTANQIHNFLVSVTGALDSTFRVMPIIASAPTAFADGILALCAFARNGTTPELLIATPGGIYRYAPWNRTSPLEEVGVYVGSFLTSVTLPADRDFPVTFLSDGNRAFLFAGAQGGAWTWLEERRLLPFGYDRPPPAPQPYGPVKASDDSPNGGGFTVRGRVGTWSDSLTDKNGTAVGGLLGGTWRWKVVFQSVTGAFSPASIPSSPVSVQVQPNMDLNSGSADYLEGPVHDWRYFLRGFRLILPEPPPGTAALWLYRTHDLNNLAPGDAGEFCLQAVVPNRSREWMDSAPDGELGAPLLDRGVAPRSARIAAFHDGSLFLANTPGQPAGVWWSEQEDAGPIPDSFLASARRVVSPSTGEITAMISAKIAKEAQSSLLLVFKATATHYLAGRYPDYAVGTLSTRAGCAGPHLVQSSPDGSVIWYGAGSFWRMHADGSIEDIGDPIRRRLRRVNVSAARRGESWADEINGEIVFFLPVDDDTTNTFAFVWDYRAEGWRTRDSVTVQAVATLPRSPLLVFGDSSNLYAWGRGYPGYDAGQPTAIYQSGWQSFHGTGPMLPAHGMATSIIGIYEERGDFDAKIAGYAQWNTDDVVADGGVVTMLAPSTETQEVPVYGIATYGASVWRARRPFDRRVPAEIASHVVQSWWVESDEPIALYTAYSYGRSRGLAGGRNSTVTEAD